MHANPDGFEPLPPYADARAILANALPSIRPSAEVSVTKAAEDGMRVNVAGEWRTFRGETTPYMVEPANMIPSRDYRAAVFCGPSQAGKTQMLQSVCAYCVTSDPARIALFQIDRDKATEFSTEKLEPMIRNSPEIRARLLKGTGANRLHQKLFRGGTHLTLNWPTASQFTSSTIRFLLMTEFDSYGKKGDIGGEGDALTLARNRPKTYRSRGMVVAESTPRAPIIDETWAATSPHECPPVEYGVLAHYNDGTRGRWYWLCPQCATIFEPHFNLLQYPNSGDPAECGEAAIMAAPCCGFPIEHALKVQLNDAGDWYHESVTAQDGPPLSEEYTAAHAAADGHIVRMGVGDVRKTDMLSYWLNGAAAAFASWAEIVEAYVKAIRRFEEFQDDRLLKTCYNTDRGEPLLFRASADGNEITLQGLKEKAARVDLPKGVAPSWTRYVITWVDTQAKYFAGVTVAFGTDGRHQLIDRFDITVPPSSAPNPEDRALDPFNQSEDWAVLHALETRAYPVDGASYGLLPKVLGVDQQGGGQTTENAYSFYRGRRKAGMAKRWYLTRGSGGKDRHSDRVWLKAPEGVSTTSKMTRRTRAQRRRPATDIEILNLSTDDLKDAVASALRLETGKNVMLLATWCLDHEPHMIEFTAERPDKKGEWKKRPGFVRNENLDGAVGCRALNIIIDGEKIDWTAPPAWARGDDSNSFAVPMDGDGEVVEPLNPRRRRRWGGMRLEK